MIQFHIFLESRYSVEQVRRSSMVVGVLLLAGVGPLDGLNLLEVEVRSLRQVTREDVIGLVDGNALLQASFLVAGVGDFELTADLPPVVEDDGGSPGPQGVGSPMSLAEIFVKRRRQPHFSKIRNEKVQEKNYEKSENVCLLFEWRRTR